MRHSDPCEVRALVGTVASLGGLLAAATAAEEGIDEFLESVLSSALLLEEDEDLKISMSTMAATMEAKSPL